MRLDETKAQLSNYEFLVEKFKKIVEYVNLHNGAMNCDVSWLLHHLSNERPRVNYSFLHERFKVECNATDGMDDNDDEYEQLLNVVYFPSTLHLDPFCITNDLGSVFLCACIV